jgi:hypothetical protein
MFVPYLHKPPKLVDTFNTWQGFRWQSFHVDKARYGKKLIKETPSFENSIWHEHLLKIIVSGHDAEFQYLLKFIADIIQDPDDKTGLIINLYSERQGTGKGLFFQFLQSIIGEQYTLIYNDNESFNSSFNGERVNKLLVLRDEFELKGGKHQKFKSEATEKMMLSNEKYKSRCMVKDRIRYITSRNGSMYLENSDRRNVCFEVSEDRIGDSKYFAELSLLLKNNIFIKRCFDYFATLKYKKSDLQKIPDNKHRREVKQSSYNNYITFVMALMNDPVALLQDECDISSHDTKHDGIEIHSNGDMRIKVSTLKDRKSVV